MFNILKIRLKPIKVNYKKLVEKGAFIIDVRTKKEFNKEHIPGAMNLPIEMLRNYITMLKDKKQPIITCCSSGSKSTLAERILMSHGYENVYSAGSWKVLSSELS